VLYPAQLQIYRGEVDFAWRRPHPQGRSPGVRGRVTTFSKRSRTRLLRRLARADSDPAWMVTLTYSGDRDPADAREDLRRWAQQMHRLASRAGVDWCCIWRLESTRAGRPHFHCLVWESRRWRPDPEAWRTRTSRENVRRHARRLTARQNPTGPGDGRRWALQVATMTEAWVRYSESGQNDAEASRLRSVDVRAVRNSRHAVSYCAKYVAKVNGGPEPSTGSALGPFAGRQWGVSGCRRMVEPVVRVALTRSLSFPQVEHLATVCEGLGLTWLARALAECRAQCWQFTSQPEAWSGY
jgi:hypothetical protein